MSDESIGLTSEEKKGLFDGFKKFIDGDDDYHGVNGMIDPMCHEIEISENSSWRKLSSDFRKLIFKCALHVDRSNEDLACNFDSPFGGIFTFFHWHLQKLVKVRFDEYLNHCNSESTTPSGSEFIDWLLEQ